MMMHRDASSHPDAQPLIPGTSFEHLPGSASLIQTFIRTNPGPNLFSTCSGLAPPGMTPDALIESMMMLRIIIVMHPRAVRARMMRANTARAARGV